MHVKIINALPLPVTMHERNVRDKIYERSTAANISLQVIIGCWHGVPPFESFGLLCLNLVRFVLHKGRDANATPTRTMWYLRPRACGTAAAARPLASGTSAAVWPCACDTNASARPRACGLPWRRGRVTAAPYRGGAAALRILGTKNI